MSDQLIDTIAEAFHNYLVGKGDEPRWDSAELTDRYKDYTRNGAARAILAEIREGHHIVAKVEPDPRDDRVRRTQWTTTTYKVFVHDSGEIEVDDDYRYIRTPDELRELAAALLAAANRAEENQ